MTQEQTISAPRLIIISHDRVGMHMAGPGIRYWEIARTLAAHQPVTLVAPHPIEPPPGAWLDALSWGTYEWGNAESLEEWLRHADVVLANGHVLPAHPHLAQAPQPLALDLYDPTLLENLELFRTAAPDKRTIRTQEDTALLNQQLQAGDFFLCATPRQRDLYLGALMGAGRITPALVDSDPHLHRLIDVVGFGLPTEAPVKQAPALRGVLEGIGADDPLLLWAGGLWDWMDPLTLVEAMPAVVAHHPTVRLVFLAGRHPGNDHPMQMPATTRARAEALGLLDSHIFFYEQWVPYYQRADFLLEATVAISLHRDHLETQFAAVRSRILDHLWAGLPSIISDGDPAAALLHQAGAALVVPPASSAALAEAITELLSDPEQRAAQSQAARTLAATLTWEHQTTPLARFCQRPWRTRPDAPAAAEDIPAPQSEGAHERDSTAPPPPAYEETLQACRDAALGVQEQSWRLQEMPVAGGKLQPLRQILIDQIVRPYLVPLIEQQQAYNTAILRSMYAINEMSDHRNHLHTNHAQYLENIAQGLREYIARVEAHGAELGQRTFHLENLSQGLHEYIERVEAHAAELGLRTLNLQTDVSKLRENDRMTRQQLYDIADQLAGLEDADTQILAALRDGVPPEAISPASPDADSGREEQELP
jgi:glycosyltransferase involved in cell wall biosynthesis